jgi:hypothetical protein
MFMIAYCNSCHAYIALKPEQEWSGVPPSKSDPLQSRAMVSASFIAKEQWEAETLNALSLSIQEDEARVYEGSLVCLGCVDMTGKSVIDIIEPAAVLTTDGSWLFLYKNKKMPNSKETDYD